MDREQFDEIVSVASRIFVERSREHAVTPDAIADDALDKAAAFVQRVRARADLLGVDTKPKTRRNVTA